MYYNATAQAKLLAGVNKVADMVAMTMGPGGKTVLINRGHEDHFTKDGVTVAKHFVLEDKAEQSGVDMVIEAAQKVVREVGDGTTTTTVMSRAMLIEAFQRTQFHKLNPHLVVKHLKSFASVAKKSIESQSLLSAGKMDDADEVYLNVGTISSNGDVDMAKLCLEVVKEVGPEPTSVTFKENEFAERDTVAYSKGMIIHSRVDSAILGPFTYSQIRPLNDGGKVAVIICDKLNEEISFTDNWRDLLTDLTDKGMGVLVVGSEFAKNMKTRISNSRERFQMGYVSPNLYGGKFRQMARDISILTKAADFTFPDGEVVKIGFTESVTIYKDRMVLNSPLNLDSQEHRDLIKEVDQMINEEHNPMALGLLKERRARLGNGTATIMVSGESEIDVIERKDRFDDCFRAICTAIKTGVVRGGGASFLDATYKVLEERVDPLNSERKAAQDILVAALIAPRNQIMMNSLGYIPRVDGDRFYKDKSLTIDAYSGDLIDAVENGILDPLGVQLSALNAAVNVASIFITTGGIYFGRYETY